jgi:type II secretory pathway component PulF
MSLLELIMILCLGAIVMCIVLSIFLPMIQVITSLGTGM